MDQFYSTQLIYLVFSTILFYYYSVYEARLDIFAKVSKCLLYLFIIIIIIIILLSSSHNTGFEPSICWRLHQEILKWVRKPGKMVKWHD